jgi:membrane fusion protein (multidrug efflux system)
VRSFGSALLAVVALLGLFSGACSSPVSPMTRTQEPMVEVIHPRKGAMTTTIQLPGDVVGFYEAALHAKVTGYLNSISVDKGDTVRAGQVLAEIEVPELRSNLARAQANLAFERITYERLKQVQLSDRRLISQQDVDLADAKYREAEAAVGTLQTMVGYTRIIAPFDGVITGRFADPGALIRAGGGDIGVDETSALISGGASEGAGGHRTGGGPVVTLAEVDKLRVYVYVPENSYPLIRRGTPAILRFDEFPGRVFRASVSRFANALDLATRTMLAEIDLDNPNHVVYPRSYAHVTLELIRHPDALSLPAAAVQRTGSVAHVLLVHNGRVTEVPVSTALESDSYIEITSGLNAGDLVVSTFNSAFTNGEEVRVDRTQMAASPPAPIHSSAD